MNQITRKFNSKTERPLLAEGNEIKTTELILSEVLERGFVIDPRYFSTLPLYLLFLRFNIFTTQQLYDEVIRFSSRTRGIHWVSGEPGQSPTERCDHLNSPPPRGIDTKTANKLTFSDIGALFEDDRAMMQSQASGENSNKTGLRLLVHKHRPLPRHGTHSRTTTEAAGGSSKCGDGRIEDIPVVHKNTKDCALLVKEKAELKEQQIERPQAMRKGETDENNWSNAENVVDFGSNEKVVSETLPLPEPSLSTSGEEQIALELEGVSLIIPAR
ncbi:hypothetical protein BLNAU_11217 [Blattamonas nauphoetae]|uniref:Uncharacterized protein n=1 Tax=Blattamonas nauphoetae TaxID=2049346 RepID=A0ABQ9XS13_9EUKA|nr:hypothetical protein BLNAU_11217 [Blattamonas nauphoetae]